ncbi:small multi-drug export protein [Candidatus Calescamantes bacterium]|nr:small multi-drug export protein [Candidatus Calescamantes bacterium]
MGGKMEINLPPVWKVFLVSTLPIAELRGGIPLACKLGLPVWKGYLSAVAGNMVPVIPLLLFLEKISQVMSKTHLGKRFFTWLFERTKKRAKIVEELEALGLALFVAIPLPVTGAWTGSVAAVLFRIRLKLAIISILGGVMLAGIIVSILTYGGKALISFGR